MGISDKIQLGIAIVAGVAAVFTLCNIYITGQHMRMQKKQWEFSHSPVFKIIKVQPFDQEKNVILLENNNDVYYQIQSVHFSDNKVKATSQRHGRVGTALNKGGIISNEKEYEGYQVVLKAPQEETVRGYITLHGIDGLGNKFTCKSENIVIEKGGVNNIYDLTQTFLTKE